MSGPFEVEPLDATRRKPRRPDHPVVPVEKGMALTERSTGWSGTLVRFGDGMVAIRRADGSTRTFATPVGGFEVGGRRVTLGAPKKAPSAPRITASGSIAADDLTPRVARASRILVEGLHDAELVERVWGDDLRAEGIVVGVLDGADDLVSVVRGFDPGPERRLGILLDHLVPGSKEQRIAEQVRGQHVTVTGHPFVDVWQSVRPHRLGIETWPVVPPGRPWKQGVLDALGVRDTPAAFWRQVLGRVRGIQDLEPELVGAVEALIDAVASQ